MPVAARFSHGTVTTMLPFGCNHANPVPRNQGARFGTHLLRACRDGSNDPERPQQERQTHVSHSSPLFHALLVRMRQSARVRIFRVLATISICLCSIPTARAATNLGLVGVATIPSSALDANGETLGGFGSGFW